MGDSKALCRRQFGVPRRSERVGQLFPAGGFHELLLGPEKDEVIDLVSTWIMQHSRPVAPIAKM